jgi:hypothetical protein
MKTLTPHSGVTEEVCSLPGAGRALLEKLPGKKTFNVTAIRTRAGIVNALLGVALASHLVQPESSVVLYLSVFLLLDMLVAASSGLRPLSPTGIIASLLASRMKFVPTPHLPKRFAWSMGASLALILVTLSLTGAADTWVSLVLVIFFTLAWLDAVMGFCMGCWIYSRLFDCQSCRLD